MTEPKFTPAPWHVEDNGLCVCDSNRVVLFLSDRPYGNETDRVDTALIAAAPEMYEALEKIADINPYTITSEVAYEIIDIAGAALRKACGESEVKG